MPLWAAEAAQPACEATLTAEVVALDQSFFYNRYGAANPSGMMFALRHDVVDTDTGLSEAEGGRLVAGKVSLRSDKRPRPLTLRVNQGQCLKIQFQNLLRPTRVDGDQPTTRQASVHVTGLPLVNSISDDGSSVGRNPSSLAAPGENRTYTLYAERQGVFMLQSTGSLTGGEGNNAALAAGLFGAVNVEPKGAEWYRSQVTADDLELATIARAQDTGHPILDYDAVYPTGHRFAGQPILKLVDGASRIVHADLNAVITGPGRGNFPAGTHRRSGTEGADRSRDEPFREFTVIFHDEIIAQQAFPGFFLDPVLSHTLHGVRDGFAINYGTAGAGSEILANRLGVGPVHDCVDCAYEEFFLASWAVGDPAMVVDVPANYGLETAAPGQPVTGPVGPKATKALYPDDPSNVYHSYLGDHVRFRNLHVGPFEHHVFHLHAHQWLFNTDDDGSSYLDSQSIGPGSGYTYEIAYNGSGNRNRSPGDAIFHCHFYPHFAQGMWSLWRNHDVFEAGTKLDAHGMPLPGSRALPDGEIAVGTPIPAVVPLPTLAMAPIPAPVQIANGQVEVTDEDKNPGFPFFIAGRAGHRPPRPPLDMLEDGGLPRHVVLAGEAHSVETRLDFSKEHELLEAEQLPEDGTRVEKAAMAFHSRPSHITVLPELKDGTAQQAEFRTNGHPAIAGAPFADPCFDDQGRQVSNRTYKIAVIQTDMTINKAGWHLPQARIGALWGDVAEIQAGRKAPEPLVFRANSNECLVIQHTNLVPRMWELDDFQVRTPTDIIGQHVHLVKFDVTASDGSGNGYNYEDGTMSPEEVLERIAAINKAGGIKLAGGQARTLAAAPHSYFGVAGAQTSVQRWYVDETVNRGGDDRTLRTVFTHDHFGPSTHQQAGLHMALAVQPKDSTWRDSETGAIMGSRFDGGPTSFRADILPPDRAKSYREFVMMVGDFAPAYEAGGGISSQGKASPDPAKAIAPPPTEEVGLPYLVQKPEICPGGQPLPCPEAVAAGDSGTWLVNYRQEPLALRVHDPARQAQARNQAGDLSLAFLSTITRANPSMNKQPSLYPALSRDVRAGDPFTPLLRTYHGDRVQLRMVAGSHEEGHISSVNGLKWLFEPNVPNSGWRNHTFVSLSQHFEFEMPIIPGASPAGGIADHLYRLNTSSDGLWHGMWGLLRSYRTLRSDLQPLPNNNPTGAPFINEAEFNGVCPRNAPIRHFDITAARAADILPGGRLVYNNRTGAFSGLPGPLNDPTAMLYVHTSDLVGTGRSAKLRDGAAIEPVVLRAAAGDCIEVQLRNNILTVADLPGYNTLPALIDKFNANQVTPSLSVGLHPQLVAVDVTRDDGMNVGLNATVQTVGPGATRTYRWYAGHLEAEGNRLIATPVEFGAANLMPSDPIKQGSKGMIGALIIEPKGATWIEDNTTRTAARITKPDGETFRELVLMLQDEVNLRDRSSTPIPNCCGTDGNEPENAGGRGINYRAEPIWFRKGYAPDLPLERTDEFDTAGILSNQATAGADPQTPVFTAKAGEKLRLRLLQASATNRNGSFSLHGHMWPREPYKSVAVASQELGTNDSSPITGAQETLGAGVHYDIVLDSAGGPFKVRGDYLFRDMRGDMVEGGRWGLLRVE